MSRRRRAEPRKVLPDPKYHDVLISKFINVLLLDGKKSIARKLLYRAMDEIQKRESEFPALGRRGFARINVGHDADIAVTIERVLSGHGFLSLLRCSLVGGLPGAYGRKAKPGHQR